MPKITKEDVTHAAELTRIELVDGETEKFTSELESVLDYVSELEKAPVESEDVEQASNLKNIMRPDEIENSLPVEKVLQNAQDKQDNFIRVKKIF